MCYLFWNEHCNDFPHSYKYDFLWSLDLETTIGILPKTTHILYNIQYTVKLFSEAIWLESILGAGAYWLL